MEVIYHGHSWFEVSADGKDVHFDPLPDRFRRRMGIEHKPSLDRKADLVAITHSHRDHWDRRIISELMGDGTGLIAPMKAAKAYGTCAKVIAEGQVMEVDGMSIKAVPAYNIGRPFHLRGRGVGYLLTIGGKTIYHAGDTDDIPEMSSLGKVDLALLPIGGTFTMDAEGAARSARRLSPKVVVPMHYRRRDPSELKRLLASDAGIRVEVMRPGDTLRL
ncbi:MAG TPA: MBL fold metallo-hydrolase [Methanomassiliicoccales archaeon]|nr:MBL fold metallo-hydrolase [Methanomassiliicoccales archaeon]